MPARIMKPSLLKIFLGGVRTTRIVIEFRQ
jgi:hypothetical protein